MLNSKTGQERIFYSVDADRGFSTLNSPKETQDKLQILAELVTYRLGSCGEGKELDGYPSPNEIRDFIERYIPGERHTIFDVDAVCATAASVIAAVQRNYKAWYMVNPTPTDALRVAVYAFDQGLLQKAEPQAGQELSVAERLKAIADQQLWIGCRVKHTRAAEQTGDSKLLKDMAWIAGRLQERVVAASATDIAQLVEQLGTGAYTDFKRLHGCEIEDRNEERRIGVLSSSGELARELSLQAQGEVIFEQNYNDPGDSLGRVFLRKQEIAVERKLGLQKINLGGEDQDTAECSALRLHLLIVAGDAEQDLFVRRVALEKLAQVRGNPQDLHHLEQIVQDEHTPLCVRFAAEVARRKWIQD
jgi:hypothetical protein